MIRRAPFLFRPDQVTTNSFIFSSIPRTAQARQRAPRPLLDYTYIIDHTYIDVKRKVHRRRRFFPDGDQEQRPQQVRTTSSARRSSRDRPQRETRTRSGPSAPARRASAPAARDRPRLHQRQQDTGSSTARRSSKDPQGAPPKALRTETGAPGHGQQPPAGTTAEGPQQVRTGTQDRQRLPSAEPRRDQQDPRKAARLQDPAQDLTGDRSGPSQDTRTRSGPSAAPRISARTRPTDADETGSSSGKGTGNGEKGPPRAGNGTGGGYTGDRERLRACISSRIGPETVRRTAAGTGRRPSAY